MLAVLVDHCATLLATRGDIPRSPFWSWLGGTGVMAFFVHTSLVLMLSLDRLPAPRKTLSFYIRRIFRIYPLSILCVLVVVALMIPGDPVTGAPYTMPGFIVLMANLLLVQNLVGHMSISTPMWSLPYEVEMYVVLPALHKLAQSRRAIGYLSALIGVFCLIGWVVQQRTSHINILGFIPCFLSGIMAYVLRIRRAFLPSFLWPLFVILWMVLGSWASLVYHSIYYPIVWVSTVLLGVCLHCFQDSTHRAWNAATELVAKYSYGLYLGHVPVLWVVFSILPVYSLWISVLIWLAGSAGVAVAAYHLLEEPMIEVGRRVGLQIAPAIPAPSPVSANNYR